MSLNLDRSTWRRVKFGDVVRNVNENVKDPEGTGIDRVIGLEHLDPGELRIDRWGELTEETTFTRRVKPGQTLFGKRRAYQRKTAYSEFDAVCSGDILVFESADPGVLLPELLPFIAMTDGFYAKALETSAGSLSPRTRWSDLATYEFDLPPLADQRRIADLLWVIEWHSRALFSLQKSADLLQQVLVDCHFAGAEAPRQSLQVVAGRGQYGLALPSTSDDTGHRYLRTTDVMGREVMWEEVPFVKVDPETAQPFWLNDGDIVISRMGANAGVGVQVKEPPPRAVFAGYLVRFVPDQSVALPGYIGAALSSSLWRTHVARQRTGTAQPQFNAKLMGSFAFPVPNLTEQRAFLSALESVQSAIVEIGLECENLNSMTRAFSADLWGGDS